MTTGPVVLVDMDGPLADFDGAFFTLCAERGWAMDCTVDQQTKRFATEHIINRKERREARAVIDTGPWFRHLPPVAGAAEGLEALSSWADVWICTKPLEPNPTCRDDKAAWVLEHLGEDWVRRLIIAPDKSLVRADLLLDDCPIHWITADWAPVVFPTPWNGKGSEWEPFPHWTWADDHGVLQDLIDR